MICEHESPWVVATTLSIAIQRLQCQATVEMNSILQVVNECDHSEIKPSYFIYDQKTGSAVKRSTENAP